MQFEKMYCKLDFLLQRQLLLPCNDNIWKYWQHEIIILKRLLFKYNLIMSLLSTALREREKKPVSEELHVFCKSRWTHPGCSFMRNVVLCDWKKKRQSGNNNSNQRPHMCYIHNLCYLLNQNVFYNHVYLTFYSVSFYCSCLWNYEDFLAACFFPLVHFKVTHEEEMFKAVEKQGSSHLKRLTMKNCVLNICNNILTFYPIDFYIFYCPFFPSSFFDMSTL